MSDESDSDRPALKRKSRFGQDGSARKTAKTGANGSAGGGGGKKMTMAQRMMAAMGYKEGQGLGKEGEGMLNPIEVKLRPQGAGVGTVQEMTQQAKDEKKRQAEIRGEKYEDSSDEERKARKKRKEAAAAAARAGTAGGASTPGGGGYFSRPKVKYRTATDIAKEAEGLEIPNILKSLIDATGKQQKLLTSTAGLLTPTGFTSSETEAEKIAKRARRELESFADAWTELTERNKHLDHEEQQIKKQIEESTKRTEELQQIIAAVESLTTDDSMMNEINADSTQEWDRLISRLEDLQTQFSEDIAEFNMDEIAVAAIHPLFKQSMADWHPLESPEYLAKYFNRLQPMLSVEHSNGTLIDYDDFEPLQQHQATSPYESLIYNLWLPKLRTTIVNDWNVHDPDALVQLVEAWKPCLPPFILDAVVNDLVVTKLTHAVQKWNPRSSLKKKHAGKLPHTWLFPWFPLLDAHHLDPSAPHGLVADVKRKFRTVLDSWDLTTGIIPRLDSWKSALGSAFDTAMLNHLLPRLATYLATDFEVYPPDQDMTPLERVNLWKSYLPRKAYVQLILQEFFPKWLNTLYQWLDPSSSPNYEEIGQWFTWWKEQFPKDVTNLPEIQEQWDKGLNMINEALDGAKVTAPTAGPMRPITSTVTPKISVSNGPTPVSSNINEPISMREVLESWCEEESLLLHPLREADERTGLPLFRVTASATGKGGVIVYIQGDNIWAQKKGERGVYNLIDMGPALVARAEGK